LPRPDFVLYPGDYLAHRFGQKFNTYAKGGPEVFQQFVIKTITFVSENLSRTFPETPIYGTLGNTDSVCGDYMIAPGGAFLAAVGELWSARSAYPEAFEDVGIGGFYAVSHPTVPDRDLIVLNNIFWSERYDDRCGPAGGDPGAAQMAWLEWMLYRTERRGRTASLLLHIPPGINALGSVQGAGTCRDRVAPYLKEAFARRFLALVEQYRGILRDSFSGHTHMDNFRVLSSAAGEPLLLTHITPSVSPISKNNPAFGLVLYDRTNGDLIDYATAYLTNLKDAGQGEPAKWAIEYTLHGAYGYDRYDPRTADALAQAIRSDATVRDQFITFFPVETSAPDPPIDQQNWKAYACAQTELTVEAFADCYCGG
ncbi:MAG: hypothetical protein AAF637_26350, partial [Pseudomonadota bacterium]